MTLRRIRFAALSVLLVVVILAAGAALVYMSQRMAADGSFRTRSTLITAMDRPVYFWTVVAIPWLAGVVFLASAPLVAWRAWKATPEEQDKLERQNPRIYGQTRRSLTIAFWVLVAMICTIPAWAVTLPLSDAERPSAPLDLRLPPHAARDAAPAAQLPTAKPVAGTGQSMRVQPIRTLFEWGVEGSREALIACQRGAYPGAAVAAYQTWTPKSNAQPDHCDRF